MQQVQNLQNKRLQQTLSSVAELNVQIVELKKRLEDVDAKNREISANIRHISGGDAPKTEKINTATVKLEGSDDVAKDEASSSTCPSTSTSVAHTTENKNAIKRRIEAEDELQKNTTDKAAIETSEDDCDLQVKKAKLQS